MKGQVAVMEYLVLVVMTMFVIFFVVVLLFGYQFLQSGSERSKDLESHSLFVLQSMIASPVVNNPQHQKGSVLDDAKLTVMTCEDVEVLFGHGLWIRISSIYEKHDCEKYTNAIERNTCYQENADIEAIENRECTGQVYPDCGVWTFCGEERSVRMIYRSVPVNIYRKMDGMVSLATITVGVKGGES